MDDIQFKRPELEDQELLEGYFRKYPSMSCERTFLNVYLWSRHYKVKFAEVCNTIIFETDGDPYSITWPVGSDENVKEALDYMLEYFQMCNLPFHMYCITPDQFEKLEKWYPGQFEIEYVRDDADYVYESEKLISLSGKKLHSKRNHINKFKAVNEDWAYETMSADNLEECFQMALKWRNTNGCEEDMEKNSEMCVTLNSLRLFEELHLKGGILRVNGEIVAFTIGEELTEDMFVVHIEKAFSDVQGAYTMINQQFVEHECSGYRYINREEDAGADGLRQAKLSYQPAFLVEKGNVTMIEE